MNLYGWCELDNEIHEYKPEEAHDLFRANAEGGWVGYGWTDDLRVEIRRTDRHTALECWAETKEEAAKLFAQLLIYRDYQE